MEQNQVEVEILTQTVTSQYGTLSQGDKLRTSPEFAKHLVEEAKAAKYTDARKASEGDEAAGSAGDTASASQPGAKTAAAAPPPPAGKQPPRRS